MSQSIKVTFEDLIHCIDRKGCDGFTIWIDLDGRIQANMRDSKTQSWICVFDDTVDGAVAEATRQFLNGNRADKPRVVKVTKARRREISDLA